jgi:hypothetical protein
LPTSFPTNEETDKFEYDYTAENFKPYYHSQNDILHSMVTEYGRGTSHYGDFGRYVFESALGDWQDADANGLSNLAVSWIMGKYGYDVEKHGEFDRNVGSGRGRPNAHEERIGKKYQWIAFFEVLARVSDNYTMYENSYSKNSKPVQYIGPWEPYVRDIDPTVTLKEDWEDVSGRFWWNPVKYDNWNLPNEEWIPQTSDLPNPVDLIQVKDLQGQEWLVLNVYLDWMEPAPADKDKYDFPRKRLYYDLISYFVSEDNYLKVVSSLSNQDLRSFDLPEVQRINQMFSREYFWALPNQTFNVPYYSGGTWDELENEKGELLGEIARTTLVYSWERERDASKIGSMSFNKPTELLFNLLKLSYSKMEGQLVNGNSELICFDPSTQNPTISYLLVRKTDLIKVLNENKLKVFWTAFGQKMVIGGRHTGDAYIGMTNVSNVAYFESGVINNVMSFVTE